MRILLDAKDLINLIEFNHPVSVANLAVWLTQNAGTLVLSFTNVSDFVGPACNRGDFLEMRVLLQKLETLPITYIREGLIIRDELRSALMAFHTGQEPPSPNPYVSRWDETFHWEGESAAKVLVGLRLDDIVYMTRGTIQGYKQHSVGLRAKIQRERVLPAFQRLRLRDIFINSISERLKAYEIDSSEIDLRAFGQWLWNAPPRCLGLRLHFEVYHQLLRDKSMAFQDGDIADFAQIASLPYVDVLTVDKRIADLLSKVFQKLRQRDVRADLSGKVFTDLQHLVAHFS